MSVQQTNFCYEISNISRLKSDNSKPIFVCGVPWEMHAVKIVDGEKRSLYVYLECAIKDTSSSWSYEACATVKLISYNEDVKSVEGECMPYAFNESNRYTGLVLFNRWDDFVDAGNGYVVNDTAYLDVTIQVADPNVRGKSELKVESYNKSCKDDCIAKFDLTVTNVENLMAVKSPELSVRDTPGYLMIFKHKGCLDMYLRMDANNPNPTHTWKILVKLLSIKGDGKSVVQFLGDITDKFIKWDELIKPENGYICDDSINLEVTIVSNDTIENTKTFLHSTTSGVSVPRFTIEIPRASTLNRVFSPEVMIRGVPWVVQVHKKIVNAEESLIVCLHHVPLNRFPEQSFVASSSIRLLSYNENVDAVECRNVPNVFHGSDIGYGDPIMKWDDLFDEGKCYVKNDKITLDIKIDVADPSESNKAKLTMKHISNHWKEDYRRFELKIENIESLVAVESSKFIMEQSPWQLLVYKHQGHLGVGLFLYSTENSCTRAMIVKVVSRNVNKKSVEQVQSKHFEPMEETFTNKLIAWNGLLKPENGFVHNKSILLEVTIAASVEEAINFHQPTAPMHEPEPNISKSSCPICFETMMAKCVSCPCGHLFCSPCITDVVRSNPVCPICRAPVNPNEMRRIYLPF